MQDRKANRCQKCGRPISPAVDVDGLCAACADRVSKWIDLLLILLTILMLWLAWRESAGH